MTNDISGGGEATKAIVLMCLKRNHEVLQIDE